MEVALEERKKSSDCEAAAQMSDLTGRRVEPWEVAFFNGAAILDVIPVQSRDHDSEQVAFRGGSFRAPTRRGHRQETEEVSERVSGRCQADPLSNCRAFYEPCPNDQSSRNLFLLGAFSFLDKCAFCFEFVLCLI